MPVGASSCTSRSPLSEADEVHPVEQVGASVALRLVDVGGEVDRGAEGAAVTGLEGLAEGRGSSGSEGPDVGGGR